MIYDLLRGMVFNWILFKLIVIPAIYLVSLLPFRVMYMTSDLLYLVVYYLVRYRRSVVKRNLERSFPAKNRKELWKIEKLFYRRFCDLFLESFKILTISPEGLRKHVTFNTGIFKKYWEKKQSVIVVMGHLGNWELAGARFGLEPFHKLSIVYWTLPNKYFNELAYRTRVRFGNEPLEINETYRSVVRNQHRVTATAFVTDQKPDSQKAFNTIFLNQETSIFRGPSRIATRLNYPMIYVAVQRVRRGLYRVESEVLVEDPQNYTEDEITGMHTRRLESNIVSSPENWFWTPRRWD